MCYNFHEEVSNVRKPLTDLIIENQEFFQVQAEIANSESFKNAAKLSTMYQSFIISSPAIQAIHKTMYEIHHLCDAMTAATATVQQVREMFDVINNAFVKLQLKDQKLIVSSLPKIKIPEEKLKEQVEKVSDSQTLNELQIPKETQDAWQQLCEFLYPKIKDKASWFALIYLVCKDLSKIDLTEGTSSNPLVIMFLIISLVAVLHVPNEKSKVEEEQK